MSTWSSPFISNRNLALLGAPPFQHLNSPDTSRALPDVLGSLALDVPPDANSHLFSKHHYQPNCCSYAVAHHNSSRTAALPFEISDPAVLRGAPLCSLCERRDGTCVRTAYLGDTTLGAMGKTDAAKITTCLK